MSEPLDPEMEERLLAMMEGRMAGQRRNLAMSVHMPPTERLRLELFADKVDRPMSWVVRDAVRLYIDACEGDPKNMERVCGKSPVVDMKDAGKTPHPVLGRPKGTTKRP